MTSDEHVIPGHCDQPDGSPNGIIVELDVPIDQEQREAGPAFGDLALWLYKRDAPAATGAVPEAVSSVDVTPTNTAQVMGLVDRYRRMLELTELEARVAALETRDL